MDKPNENPVISPGYEPRDANVRGVFGFLVVLSVVLVGTALVCWGLFRYLSARPEEPASSSPFAGTRELPLGPELQVNPRQDFVTYREEQEKSLESYAWENRSAGTVRVPIEQAMELLLRKGLPVQAGASPTQPVGAASKTPSKRPLPSKGEVKP